MGARDRGRTIKPLLLPGVPAAHVHDALLAAPGDEIGSGKLASPVSSAALAVNGLGWFLDRPAALPPFPGLDDLDWPAVRVDVERCVRFPWSAGRHPWLDAVVETSAHLVGVESKRFEPFRDAKRAVLSPAYDRDVWGSRMVPWTAMRDRLRADPRAFRRLDAGQLVKHALGLLAEAGRTGKAPVLLYLFAEPTGGPPIPPAALAGHRAELSAFAEAVAGATVRFQACTWREWLARFTGPAADHANAVLERFRP